MTQKKIHVLGSEIETTSVFVEKYPHVGCKDMFGKMSNRRSKEMLGERISETFWQMVDRDRDYSYAASESWLMPI